MICPVRLQLSREKGFNLQEHSRVVNGLSAVNVTRPGKWGNPFCGARHAVEIFRELMINLIENDAETRAVLEGLRGKNLACWCALDQPCQADILLELANR